MELIKKQFTLDYWPESGWFEGRLREIPEVLSQGQTRDELEEHVREDCAELLLDEEYAREHGYAHLDAADVRNADLNLRRAQPLPGRLRPAPGPLPGARARKSSPTSRTSWTSRPSSAAPMPTTPPAATSELGAGEEEW